MNPDEAVPMDGIDSGNETSNSDDADFSLDGSDQCSTREDCFEDGYQYEVILLCYSRYNCIISLCTCNFIFQVLTTEQIVLYMTEIIKDVVNVAELPPTTARILLNHFNWDKDRLMEEMFDGDQDKLFAKTKVPNPFKVAESLSKSKLADKPVGRVECEICFVLNSPNCMTGLDCGHRFCLFCWGEYFRIKIIDEGVSQLECPAHGCNMLVDDSTVMRLIKDPKVRLRFQHLITNNFVKWHSLLRWCPAPDCNFAIRVLYRDCRPVSCKCGHTFCFKCGENWHDPVNCRLMKKWIKKFEDDSETSNWLAANTKDCPKCHATIEKDGGCNHMVCKNQNCKADFCWVCLGPWEPHGSSWYNCNRFEEMEAKAARDAQEKSRMNLQRYLFYCNRYMNHMQSMKFENKLYASVKTKMEEMQQQNMSWNEVQFLRKAVDVLCRCRQTLMYTYVFAYYVIKTNQSTIFEDNQRDLETATEMLSEYLERDITSANLIDIKQKVLDKSRYCDSRRKVLLEHVHEGYEKDWWTYME